MYEACDEVMISTEKRRRQVDAADDRSVKHCRLDSTYGMAWDDGHVKKNCISSAKMDSAMSFLTGVATVYGPAESAIAQLSCCYSF